MRSSKPFLGTVPTFKAAYPEVRTIEVNVRYEAGMRGEFQGTREYSEHGLPPVLPYSNPKCRQGGYNLMATLITLTHAKQPSYSARLYCHGHEGTPKGRKVGDACDASAEIEITLSYK
jgi:hypothetical protein